MAVYTSMYEDHGRGYQPVANYGKVTVRHMHAPEPHIPYVLLGSRLFRDVEKNNIDQNR